MTRVKSLVAYSAAALSIPIMVVAVLAWTVFPWAKSLVSAMGLKHSANWTGGEVMRTIEHGTYRTDVHRSVFDALIGEHKEGFVQVAWRPTDSLPARIDEEIDVDGDGQADFRIELDTATRQASLAAYSPGVMSLQGVYRLKETLAIRVTLKNPRE